jgi:flagellin-like hook-associated protein FlgL
MSNQIKKDVETLHEIQRRILMAQPENDEAANCLNRAYSGIAQAIEALENLQDVLLQAAQGGQEEEGDPCCNPKGERN